MYEVFHRAAKIAPKLPRWLRRTVSVAVGSLAWVFARRERDDLTANVSQVLGPSVRRSFTGRVRVQFVVRRIFCNCISNYLELFALPGLTKQEVLARIDIKGLEHFEEALSHGRGVILFSAHLGPFEYLTSWFPVHGYEMVIPVEKVRDERMLRLMLDSRLSNGVEFVPLQGSRAIRAMLRVLRRNQIVLITSDRAVEGESVVLDFFGAPARLPLGPVNLSILTGAPLVGGFGWRNTDGRDVIEFTRLTYALEENQRKDPVVLQAALTRHLETIVRDHLDQWVVFEPLWANAGSAGT